MVLRRFLEQKHYQPLQWNDSSSSLLFDKWISELDEDKRYFTQADIKELNGYRYKLGDEMLGKSWQFFDRSVYFYHLRLQQSDSILNSLLNKPLDFSKPDSIHFLLQHMHLLYKCWRNAGSKLPNGKYCTG